MYDDGISQRDFRRRRVGAVPRRRGPLRDARPRRAEPRRLAAMIELWWERGAPQRRAAARQPPARTRSSTHGHGDAVRGIATSTRRSARRCPNRRPYTYRTASTRSRPRSRSTARPWPKGCCSRWDQGWAVSRSTSATAACATCTTSTARSATSSLPTMWSHRDPTSSGTSTRRRRASRGSAGS